MALSELDFHKTAFWGVTPFDVKNKKEWDRGGGYLKEYGNRIAGSFLGALPGVAVMLSSASGRRVNEGLMALGTLGALAGACVGDVRSLRKTEREAGVKETNVGQYLGRGLGGAIGGPIGDYYVSRDLQKH